MITVASCNWPNVMVLVVRDQTWPWKQELGEVEEPDLEISAPQRSIPPLSFCGSNHTIYAISARRLRFYIRCGCLLSFYK